MNAMEEIDLASPRLWQLAIECADKVYQGPTLLGTIHCWTKQGAALRLETPIKLPQG